MRKKLSILILAISLAVAASSTASSLTGTPYYGYCSQTCSRCFSGDTQPCPPDPDTGFRQTCTRIPLC
jgi:hypothetical protein